MLASDDLGAGGGLYRHNYYGSDVSIMVLFFLNRRLHVGLFCTHFSHDVQYGGGSYSTFYGDDHTYGRGYYY